MICSVREKISDKNKHYLPLYVTALSLAAENPQQNEMHFVLRVYAPDGAIEKHLYIFPDDARKILNTIYKSAFIDQYMKCVPMSLLEKEEALNEQLKLELKTLNALKEKLESDYGPWAFFSHKDLFNVETDIGYTHQNFKNEWIEANIKQKSLITYIQT